LSWKNYRKFFKETEEKMKKLYLSDADRKIGGVCGGLGEHFEKDPIIFRIIFVILFLTGGVGLLAYIIMWLVIPRRPKG